jgi:type II secretory ATPase GspE/PulE/Tfp pilus assembly ATPase PilB-like protein
MEKIVSILKRIPENSKTKVPTDLTFFHSQGCDKCQHIGYLGRLGVYEVLENTEAIQKLILAENTSMAEFKKVAVAQGMITMTQDGLLKALDGLTDVEEVFRVAGEM